MSSQQSGFRVPRSRASQTHAAMRDEIEQAIEPILFGNMAESYAVRGRLESAFAAEVKQKYAVAVHSGTIGLFLALRACGITSGDEVITVGNSDISTTAAIRQCGAEPVLCDVLTDDYTINTELVEALLSPRTRALLPVDLYGHPANVKALRSLAQKHDLKIIEDAALATGAHDHGQPAGAFADATIFSFAPFKPLGSVGNGAMVVTNDDDIYEQLRRLTHYGHSADTTGVPSGHQHYVGEGYNVPLDGLQAAIVLTKLPYLKKWTAQRQAIAQAYHDGLKDTSARIPIFRPEASPTFRSYTICVEDQAGTYRYLRDAGIEVVLHYTPAIYKHIVYDQRPLINEQNLPVTDRLAESLICLPVTPELTKEDTRYVINKICNILK
ncbi:MAG: DegT/DnrJ/EryC1/StrS family aminotransferase [Anaerolineaceae bacterium]|nr:MAG: DegT/DnrJ/EryC1/StrS family aminotransferase [Anaerolineaceae bacterium]